MLREVSVESEADGRRWQDHHGTALVTTRVNESGLFARMENVLVSNKGKVFIFFPARKNGGGWLALAEAMAKFVG